MYKYITFNSHAQIQLLQSFRSPVQIQFWHSTVDNVCSTAQLMYGFPTAQSAMYTLYTLCLVEAWLWQSTLHIVYILFNVKLKYSFGIAQSIMYTILPLSSSILYSFGTAQSIMYRILPMSSSSLYSFGIAHKSGFVRAHYIITQFLHCPAQTCFLDRLSISPVGENIRLSTG